MQENETVFPLVVGTLIVAVVVLDAVVTPTAAVLRSLTAQFQPCGAITFVPKVIVVLHVPVVPLVNCPAVLPPTRADGVQPLSVNVPPGPFPETKEPVSNTGKFVSSTVPDEVILRIELLMSVNSPPVSRKIALKVSS